MTVLVVSASSNRFCINLSIFLSEKHELKSRQKSYKNR